MQARLCGGSAAIRPAMRSLMCGRMVVIGGPLLVLLSAGCGARRVDYPADLAAQDPAMRIRAVQVAGERGDQGAVPLLVDRLEDEDAAVRFYAFEALRRITGEDHGYRYYKPGPERAKAVERWRRHLRQTAEPSPGKAGPNQASPAGSSSADLSQ